MKNRRGLTLIEIIIALALIGIIAIGIIPTFAMQFKILVDTKDITVGAFEAQGAIEKDIADARETIISGIGTLPNNPSFTIWGIPVHMYEIISTFPSNDNKHVYAYLSGTLASKQDQTNLIATNVLIKVNNISNIPEDTADMRNSPIISAECDDNIQPTWITNIYIWYKSKPGNTDPKFPEDYIIHERTTSSNSSVNLIDKTGLINRYLFLTVTPVDMNGVRGAESFSSNRVLVLGNEWRTGSNAWVDKNLDDTYITGTDIQVNKPENLVWALLKIFDSQNTFQNPQTPATQLDPSGGSLYVPMRIPPSPLPVPPLPPLPSSTAIGDIVVDTGKILDWTIDKSINLATNIKVSNNTDINIKSRDGNITLWQFVLMNSLGTDAIYEAYGSSSRAKVINNGASLLTSRDINLSSGIQRYKQGDIILQNYSSLYADSINLSAKGHIYLMGNNFIQATNNISLDSTPFINETGNRDINITGANISLIDSPALNTKISIISRDLLNISATTFKGNQTSGDSNISLSATEGIDLINTYLNYLNIDINNDTNIVGGGWSSGKTLKVEDGKALTFEASGPNKVNNGNLVLGNTGAVNFKTSMTADITNPLTITLSKGTLSNQVLISNNYGRNVGYADSKPVDSIGAMDSYQNLGANRYNLEYKVKKISGYGNVTGLSLDFDGTNSIKINATTTGEVSANYELWVRDKFSDSEVFNKITFKVKALDMGLPTVTIGGQNVPTYTVTFDLMGGVAIPPISPVTVTDSEPLSTLPPQPTKAHYNFLEWNSKSDGTGIAITTATHIFADMTVYAQWTSIPVYTVTFDLMGGVAIPAILPVNAERGTSLGSLPTTQPTKTGYRFASWNTIGNGSGATFTGTTIVNASITVYAQYIPAYIVKFDKNNSDIDSVDANPTQMYVDKGLKLLSLPTTPPTRTNYIFGGWNTKADGTGTKVVTPLTVGSDVTLFAKWYKSFSSINTGDYINVINNSSSLVLFQKVSNTQLLVRLRTSSIKWAAATNPTTAYWNSYTNNSWITNSGILSKAEIDSLPNSIKVTSVTQYTWWTGTSATTSNAYIVSLAGDTLSTFNKNNNNGYRPYIVLNPPSNLGVLSGSGTSLLPYTLGIITP